MVSFDNAMAVWQMADGDASVGTGLTLTPNGKVSLGIALTVQDQEYSRKRGFLQRRLSERARA